jgi:DNA-binding transcriptional ArsR family regulator
MVLHAHHQAQEASDLAGALQAARREIEGAKTEVRDALRGAHAEITGAQEKIAGAREQVALLQEVVRTVTDVDTIKALADPTRLSILRALSRDRMPKSAKELAEDLDQPQTKLYRHLKVLQEAGLIEAAETRVVSGIVETKYRAMQSGLSINPTEHLDETREAMHNIIAGNLNDYRDRMLRAVELDEPETDEEAAKRRGMMMNLSATISAEDADDFQRRLEALVAEFDEFPRDPGGVRVEGLISWFRPKRPGETDGRPGAESA